MRSILRNALPRACRLERRPPAHGLKSAIAVAAAAVIPLMPAPARAEEPPASIGKIASLQNQVETKPPADEAWAPSILNQALYQGSRVRTGPSSRAGILYADQTLHRLNEKSEIEILVPTAERPGLLKLLFGTHYFSSRAPKQFRRIETPVVTAAIRGTEFVVDVTADTTTRITMLDGSLEASNSYGSLTVQTGEQAYVEPGKAPVKRIVVRPRDAVAWALYYPPVLGGSDARRLQEGGAEGRDLARAAALLSAGQVDQARPVIEAARAARPGDPVALALASVIELTAREKGKALALAEQALASDPRSAAAALAVSFAAQAYFDIRRARTMAEKAAENDPESSLALARLAELRMSEGNLKAAEEVATRAVERTPEESRALAVLGFVKLAQFRSEEAERWFEKSVAADSTASVPRLGLGLARIRRGKVDEGREELQTAVAIDPDDSLLRSYLGKAYYEERRRDDAGKELALAKVLDVSDPTPYLYDAIRKQNENRPAEALDDLRKSITLNDRRAVYRSRLLLDQDLAVRGTDLARIYNDLGFNQLGLVAARRSADEDQANYSSHLFLSGNYRNVPDFAPAFLSEVLQARIYQPVSVNAARPDVVNQTVSFNEYTALLDRPRARAFGGLGYGVTDTDLSEFCPPFPPNCLDSTSALGDSLVHTGEVVGTLNSDRFSGAIGYRRNSSDGFRVNNDQTDATYHGFLQFAPSYRDSFQLNSLEGRDKTGDIPLRFDLITNLNLERFDTRLQNIGAGYHRIFSPGSDLVVSAIYNSTRQTASIVASPGESTGVLKGPQLEVQQVFRRQRTSWILGAGRFWGETRIESPGASTLRSDDRFTNGYGYLDLRAHRKLEVTLGAAYEDVVSPTGLQPPRDFLIVPAEVEFTKSRLSPKVAVSFFPHPKTTLRAALFYRLTPAIGRIQTLEPTQVGGFNQFFTEPGGTRSKSYGVGLDQEFTSRLFAGFSFLRRRLTIPETSCFDAAMGLPDPVNGCGSTFPVTTVVDRESQDIDGSAYFNAVLGKRLAFAVDYSYQKREFDFTEIVNDANFPFVGRLETHRARPQLRFFLPSGWFATATGNYFRQEVDARNVFDPVTVSQFDPSLVVRQATKTKFWILDLSVGYKFPGRYGSVLLDARNLTDREFNHFERAIEDTIVPARTVTLLVNFTL